MLSRASSIGRIIYILQEEITGIRLLDFDQLNAEGL